MGKTLIYGSGISGMGAAQLMKALKIDYDTYLDGVEDLNVDSVFSGNDIDTLVISPGIAMTNPLVKAAKLRGIEVIGEIELAYRHCLADIIAITGTNGKTTTVTLAEAMLRASGISAYALGNNGVSFSGKVADLALSDVVVLEVSSFQLESTKRFCPKIAVCLNIAPDHLERHGSMNEYALCKRKIFATQTASDYAVLNYDDETVVAFGETTNANTYYFSLKSVVRGTYVCGNGIYFKDKAIEYVCSTADIKARGEHNLMNALAVITIAKILNIPNSVITKVLNDFTPPLHRNELVDIVNGTRYFNDSKATNTHATLSACATMEGKTVLLAGGYDKGLDYSDFLRELPLKVSAIVCYGANRGKILHAAKNICSLTVIEAENLEEAVNIASHIRADNVLLSPTTSSFDAYRSYEERGEHFVQLVKKLKSKS